MEVFQQYHYNYLSVHILNYLYVAHFFLFPETIFMYINIAIFTININHFIRLFIIYKMIKLK